MLAPSADHDAYLVKPPRLLEYLGAGLESSLPGKDMGGGTKGTSKDGQGDPIGLLPGQPIRAPHNVPFSRSHDRRRPPDFRHVELQMFKKFSITGKGIANTGGQTG